MRGRSSGVLCGCRVERAAAEGGEAGATTACGAARRPRGGFARLAAVASDGVGGVTRAWRETDGQKAREDGAGGEGRGPGPAVILCRPGMKRSLGEGGAIEKGEGKVNGGGGKLGRELSRWWRAELGQRGRAPAQRQGGWGGGLWDEVCDPLDWGRGVVELLDVSLSWASSS